MSSQEEHGIAQTDRRPVSGNDSPSAQFSCDEVRAGYGDLEIVHGFTMDCNASEVVGIIGPNGCGKSTLLKRLAGLLPASGGKVLHGDRDVTTYSPGELARAGLHYGPQERDTFPSLTVRENLLIGDVDQERLDYAIETVNPDLRNMLRRKAGRLSGGERKSLAIARALMKPTLNILLLDEPSAGLSPAASAHLWPVITQVARNGVAVVVVEQRVEELLAAADRVYVMVDGRNREERSAQALRGHMDELARIFMGS